MLNVLATTLSEKNSNGDISKYNQELQQIMKKQGKLLDMFLDETIGKVEYNEKKEELAAKQASIEKIIADYNKVDKTVKDKTTRLKEIETKIKEIQDNPDCISQELIDLIVRFVIINDKNEAGRYSIEIIFDFNDNQDATIDTERITLFNTTYPFIKQCCVDKTEDWDIIVSLI